MKESLSVFYFTPDVGLHSFLIEDAEIAVRAAREAASKLPWWKALEFMKVYLTSALRGEGMMIVSLTVNDWFPYWEKVVSSMLTIWRDEFEKLPAHYVVRIERPRLIGGWNVDVILDKSHFF